MVLATSFVVKFPYVLEVIRGLLEILLPLMCGRQTVSSAEVFTGGPAFYLLIIKNLIMQSYWGAGALIKPTAVTLEKILHLSLGLGASEWRLCSSFGVWSVRVVFMECSICLH